MPGTASLRVVRRCVIVAMICLPVVGLIGPHAMAFKPYTHNHTADTALQDVVDDGRITIDGRTYAVRPAVVAALRAWPAHYNAGVVGPDGFPDLTHGQSVVHPERTGAWLDHLFRRAWSAQADPAYTPMEGSQILAFTYGYLIHAAGDVWSHTLVNDFSGGVFPSLDESFFSDTDKVENAIRHVIVEGYIDDATPGFDGDPARGPAPGVNEDGDPDHSDDSTPGVPYAVPTGFVYDTLIDPAATLPGESRGPVIDFFLDLRAQLEQRKSEAGPVIERYLEAWIDDIDEGLEEWPKVGLAVTRALFDPQAYRDAQNSICRNEGKESDPTRIDCEDGVEVDDVLEHELDPFINEHLLSMMGLPDAAGNLRAILGALSELLDDVLGSTLDLVGRPIEEVERQIEELILEFILDKVEEQLGVDVEQLESFLTSPSHWLDQETVTLQLPGRGEVTLDLFGPGEHERLDALMGLPADHHADTTVDLPDGGSVASSRLADGVTYDPQRFEAAENSVTLSKLSLLDGAALNRYLGDQLAAPDEGGRILDDPSSVNTYVDGTTPANVMIQPLSGHAPWLLSIDADHAWRADGLPTFPSRPEGVLHGGNGLFPMWESCLLRPAFRRTFDDWENGELTFPALGDEVSADPSDTSQPSVSGPAAAGDVFEAEGTTFVGPEHELTVTAADEVFTDEHVDLRTMVSRAGGGADPVTHTTNPARFGIPLEGGDGRWSIDMVATDPCNPAGGDSSVAGRSETVVLDTTAPAITVASPAPEGVVFDSDETVTVDFSADDGDLGSGVAGVTATLDGDPVADDTMVASFDLGPGTHQIVTEATDNLGNAGDLTRTFVVRATAEGLLANLDEAWAEGLITDRDAYEGLRDKLEAAIASHDAGRHHVEHNQLGAFVNQLEALAGHTVDAELADTLIAFTHDLIENEPEGPGGDSPPSRPARGKGAGPPARRSARRAPRPRVRHRAGLTLLRQVLGRDVMLAFLSAHRRRGVVAAERDSVGAADCEGSPAGARPTGHGRPSANRRDGLGGYRA